MTLIVDTGGLLSILDGKQDGRRRFQRTLDSIAALATLGHVAVVLAGSKAAAERVARWLAAGRYNFGYTRSMKTAVSIPDDLFESAEGFARYLGMSRSELYAKALREYLEEHGREGITERLDEIYGEEDTAEGVLDSVVARLQERSLPEEDGW